MYVNDKLQRQIEQKQGATLARQRQRDLWEETCESLPLGRLVAIQTQSADEYRTRMFDAQGRARVRNTSSPHYDFELIDGTVHTTEDFSQWVQFNQLARTIIDERRKAGEPI